MLAFGRRLPLWQDSDARLKLLSGLVAVCSAALAVWTFVLSSAPVAAQTRYTQAEEQQFHEQATRALAHGQFEEAETLVATRPSTDPAAVAVRARMLVRRGRYGEAEQLLRPVAAVSPASATGLELGLLLMQTGRANEAAQFLELVVSVGSRSLGAVDQYHGGLAARALGAYRQANTLLRSATQASPSDPAFSSAWAELFLEKYNNADAVQSFQEALSLDDEWAPAHLGMARALVDENPAVARASADRALAIDANNAGAHLFIAEQELGDRNTDAARESIERALEINSASLEARALLAAMAYLGDRTDEFEAEVARALEINPAYGDIYRVAGSQVARAYRFDEAVALVQRGLELDPNSSRAQAELGMHLLRTGDEPGAREALERAFADDPFDVITFNLLSMMDTLDEFETFERGDIIARLHPDESPVLREYVLSLAQEALDTMAARYEIDVEGPILVEVFPRHDDFAVRNLGLPGMIGALGACFGRVVTMDSPRARPPGDFNWRATLWHEMAHVITLQMSKQRVPRWLTEGVSVFEEQRARTAWGRDQGLIFARALNDDAVLALRDLNAGFSRPETISLAYFQASVLVEHIVDRYGEGALRELVTAYGDGLETEQALERINLDFDTLQASFDEAVEVKFGDLRRALRPLDDGPPGDEQPNQDPAARLDALRRLAGDNPDRFSVQFSFGMALRAAGELDAALDALERAAALAPTETGIDSPRGVIAAIAQEQGDRERAMRELEQLLEHDHTSLEVAQQLAALAEEVGDEARMELAYDRLIGINPFDAIPHQAIGRMAMARGDTDTSTREFQVALAVGPVDRVAAHCDLSESHLMAGELDEAKRAALAALELAPTYERAQELLLRVVEGQP